jgi:3-hydroxyacyl-CoA dehydrogenase
VEISRGEKTSGNAIRQMVEFLTYLAKEPVVLQKEALGFIANRLAMALYREAVDLVVRGVCSIEDVDKAACYGPGLRYAAMGPNLLYHLGGGPHGIKGLLQHIGPSVELWWKDMSTWTEWPAGWGEKAQSEVLAALANRPDGQGANVQELAQFRDEVLLSLLRIHNKL